MKLEINIGNQQLMFLVIFVAAMAVVSIAGAYNPDFAGGNPAIMGHSSDEIMVNLSGTPTSLQNAVDSRARIKTGSYAGGTSQEIDVGFAPDNVIIASLAGGNVLPALKTKAMSGSYARYADAYADNLITLTQRGFMLEAGSTSNVYVNSPSYSYSYTAMKDG